MDKEALVYHSKGRPGKIEVHPTKETDTQKDLALAYSPGVAAPCLAIEADASKVYDYTTKGNLVAVISNGTAVLGLGDIGPLASKPVMEGKAVLFKKFADIDVFDLELDTKDIEEFIRTVKILSPTFGGINLEDISAPDCFEIEERLNAELNIPIMHDDQHGTAIVVLAALRNALKFVKKDLGSVKIVLSGVGAAGNAIARLLTLSGAKNIIGFNHHGVIHNDMKSDDSMQQWFIDNSNPNNFIGTMPEALVGADVFIGVSAPNILKEADIATMAKDSIIFALANPDPEVDPVLARKYATVVATGRSDQPNQINNVLAFPGIFRGLLDANAHKITDQLLVAAAEAIADCVSPEQLNASFIVPSVFDPNVTKAVAAAVKKSV